MGSLGSVASAPGAFARDHDADCNRALLKQYYETFSTLAPAERCAPNCHERLQELVKGREYESATWFRKLIGQKWKTEFQTFSVEESLELSTLLSNLHSDRDFRLTAQPVLIARLIAMKLEELRVPFTWREVELPKSKGVRVQLVIKPDTQGLKSARSLGAFAAELAASGVDTVFDATNFSRGFNASFEDRTEQPTVMTLPLDVLILPVDLSSSIAHEKVHFETWKKVNGKQTVLGDVQLIGAAYLNDFQGSIQSLPELVGHLRYAKRTSFDEWQAYRAGAEKLDEVNGLTDEEHLAAQIAGEVSIQYMHVIAAAHGHWYRQAADLVHAYLHSKEHRRDILIQPIKRGSSQIQHVAIRINFGEGEALVLMIPVSDDFGFTFPELDQVLKNLRAEAVGAIRESVQALRARTSLSGRFLPFIEESEAFLKNEP